MRTTSSPSLRLQRLKRIVFTTGAVVVSLFPEKSHDSGPMVNFTVEAWVIVKVQSTSVPEVVQSWAAGGVTVIDWVTFPVALSSSVTVSVTVYVPAAA